MNQEQVILVGNIAIFEGCFQVFLYWNCNASRQVWYFYESLSDMYYVLIHIKVTKLEAGG